MVKKVIGVSGVARAGKDTFAAILMNQLNEAGKSVSKYALADALKADCDEFCQKNFGFSAFTQVPEEKLIIRPLLVWYGDAQRQRTNGTYWINIIHEKLKKDNSDFAIITDIRYAHYPKDEIQWVKNDCDGVVVHISRYKWTCMWDKECNEIPGGKRWKAYTQPANDHETLNDPKVKALSDFRVEWEHINDIDLIHSPYLNSHVKTFIDFMHLLDSK